jgi:hypothetical protein
MEQRHCINLKIPIEHLWINLHEIAEGAAHGVVDEDLGRTEFAADRLDRSIELAFVGDVAWIASGVWDFAFQAKSRSRVRASIATLYPPIENRRAIAAPVPGPTPVTTTIGGG